MSPSNNVGMELPPPVNEQLPPVTIPEQVDQKPEHPASPFETASISSAAVSAALPIPPPPPIIPGSAIPHMAASDDSQTTNAVADDSDLIEKEWVNKAKSIVERTKEDPYKQSEELKLLKSDYLQKRYNKIVKQSS
jgi:hypothetical protein